MTIKNILLYLIGQTDEQKKSRAHKKAMKMREKELRESAKDSADHYRRVLSNQDWKPVDNQKGLWDYES